MKILDRVIRHGWATGGVEKRLNKWGNMRAQR
jgi:hypothetical protein